MVPCEQGGFAFPRRVRLTSPKDFERALRRPDKRLRAGPLRIALVRNRMHTARLGLVVGKKAIAKAHERNRVKRIIRNRFRGARASLPNVDLVVRVIAPGSDRALHEALDDLFSQLEKQTVEDSPAS